MMLKKEREQAQKGHVNGGGIFALYCVATKLVYLRRI